MRLVLCQSRPSSSFDCIVNTTGIINQMYYRLNKNSTSRQNLLYFRCGWCFLWLCLSNFKICLYMRLQGCGYWKVWTWTMWKKHFQSITEDNQRFGGWEWLLWRRFRQTATRLESPWSIAYVILLVSLFQLEIASQWQNMNIWISVQKYHDQ